MADIVELRRPGLWTPWAQLICYKCHGPKFPRATIEGGEWAEHCSLQPARPGNAGAICDDCGCEIWVPEELAWLQEIKRRCGMGTLAQTGGMCAALEIETGKQLVWVSALDGPICVGIYTDEDAAYDGQCEGWGDAEEGDIDGSMEILRRLAPEIFEDEEEKSNAKS